MVQPTPKERPLAATLPHTLSSQQVLDELNVDSLRGLASNTAAARQQQWGPNQVSSESGPSWPIILFGMAIIIFRTERVTDKVSCRTNCQCNGACAHHRNGSVFRH